jgi:hypothetical protein
MRVSRKDVRRIGIFVHTHSDPDTGDLHARDGSTCTPDNVSARTYLRVLFDEREI